MSAEVAIFLTKMGIKFIILREKADSQRNI